MRFMMIGSWHGHGHDNGSGYSRGRKQHGVHEDDDVMSLTTGEMVEAVVDTVENPPATWQPYLEKKDYKGIYEMESDELAKAFKASMSGEASMKDVAREIRHTFAAMLLWQSHNLHEEKA